MALMEQISFLSLLLERTNLCSNFVAEPEGRQASVTSEFAVVFSNSCRH